MLRFKSWRKSPALTQETTPSQKRIVRVLSEAQQAGAAHMAARQTEVAAALERGRVERVIALLPTEPWLVAQEALAEELLGELLDAGSRVRLPTIEKATLEFSFDRGRPESARWARNSAGALITQIIFDQREVVRDVVARAAMGDADWTQVARTVRGTIGLTTQQAGWVANHYERAYTAAIGNGAGSAQAAALARRSADRYQTTVHRYRANTIARTETMRAASEGRIQAWNQGMAQGFISPLWEKEWIAESDACPICQTVDGTRVRVKESFPVGEPPAHPNCRCDVLLVPPKAQPQPQQTSPLDVLPLDQFAPALLPGGALSVPAQLPSVAIPTTPVRQPTFIGMPGTFIGMPRVITFDSIIEQAEDLENAAGDWMNSLHGDPLLAEIYKVRGYDGLPVVVEGDAFDALVQAGATPLYRGIYGPDAQAYLDQFRYGTYFAGRGAYGNGTYTAQVIRIAMGYGQELGNVMRMTLADGSRVITDEELVKQWMAFTRSDAYDALSPAAQRMVGDQGRFAAMMGYDAIRVERIDADRDYIIILNRSRITVDRNNGLGPTVVSREDIVQEWGSWLASPAFDYLDPDEQLRFTDVDYYAVTRGYTAVLEQDGQLKDLTWVRDRYLTGVS